MIISKADLIKHINETEPKLKERGLRYREAGGEPDKLFGVIEYQKEGEEASWCILFREISMPHLLRVHINFCVDDGIAYDFIDELMPEAIADTYEELVNDTYLNELVFSKHLFYARYPECTYMEKPESWAERFHGKSEREFAEAGYIWDLAWAVKRYQLELGFPCGPKGGE